MVGTLFFEIRKEQLVKEVRKALVPYNLLGRAVWDFNGRDRMQQLVAVTDERVGGAGRMLGPKGLR
jgi:hypothetical protein